MNALITHQFEDFEVRVIMVDEEPWFVAKDLCAVLAIGNVSMAVNRLDDDERGVSSTEPLYSGNTPAGGNQEISIVSESGMYSLVLGSRKPEAKRFKKWVTSELLPTLRRTGRYILHDAPPPAPPLALVSPDIDPPRIMAAVALTNAARKLYGVDTARAVWVRCGLPVAVAEAAVTEEGDPLEEPVRAWLAGRDAVTIRDVAEGIGIAEPDGAMRYRIGALLRMAGWTCRTARRGHDIVKLFVAPACGGEAA